MNPGVASAAVVSLLCMASNADAYEIGSHSKAKRTYDVHETMTALALKCSEHGTVRPTNCIAGWHPVDHSIRQFTFKARRTKPGTIGHDSRWADDPVRQLDRTPSSAHWGAAMWNKCARILTRDRFIDNVGLACSAHFGRLQYWHAMASEPDETTEQTRSKILAWADFAYRTATIPRFRGSDYCTTVEELGDQSSVRASLTFSDKTFCGERPAGWLGRRAPAWRVATLFGLTCRSPFTTRAGCRDLSVHDDERARTAAIGALLHLVQDSYSQAHVGRWNPDEPQLANTGPFWNRVVCRPAAKFYDYLAQQKEGPNVHSPADQPPVIDRSCFANDRKVDDVITASANVLWFTAKADADRTPEKFVRYLATSVFRAS